MQKTIFLLSALLMSNVSMAASAQIKVIYGDDDRVEVNDANPLHARLAKSTAAMIPNSKLEEHNAVQILLGGRTLQDSGMCASERFSSQPTVANCSGFLVSKNVLVTAGHCVRSDFDCSSSSWVFDYKVDHTGQSEVVVDKSNVYKCKKIISQDLNNETKNDYAVLELDREVLDRKPLKLRKKGQPSVGDELVVIGHPSGLPTKIADNAIVREVKDIFLVASLDTYGGNSGSAVFNAKSGLVEGILVRGDTDYVFDSEQGCRVSNTLGQDAGRGEDVTLISSVNGLPEAEETDEPTPEEPSVEPEEPEAPVVAEPTPQPQRRQLPMWLLRLLALLS